MSDAASTPTAPAAPSGERRQVTALFADMVGFTAISERLGEEGTFALIQPIYELMAARGEGAGRLGQGLHRRRHHGAVRRARRAGGRAAAGLPRGIG